MLYINLDRSKDRKVAFEAQMQRFKVKTFKRVPAFDGRKIFSDAALRARTVELPKDMKQSSGEIGCSLSHLRAAEMALEIDAPYVLVMEDDIHLTFYKRWRTSIEEIVWQAPKDWQVLQLTINNVRVLRTLMGLGVPFVPWRKNHWSTGAYLINRKGCRRTVDEFCQTGKKAHYKLPGGVQLVSDVLMYNGPGAYTYTRPLLDHEIKESTIHQGHVESCHRQAAELSAAFYERMDVVWAGGDDARAAVACVLTGDCASPEALERLSWWLAFHLRLGFRWCLLYVNDEKTQEAVAAQVKWIGAACAVLVAPGDEVVCARDATGRARLAGASWLVRLVEHELLYVLPGRSLRSVFDEAKRRGQESQRGRGNDQTTIFNIRFDSLEAQRKAWKGDKDVLNSTYNYFAEETLFKRRTQHVDGSSCSSSDDRAYYDVNPEAARLRRLPAGDEAALNLASSSGRSAGRLAEPGLAPHGPHGWRSARGEPQACGGDVVSTRAFVLTFPYCHFESWRSQFSQKTISPTSTSTLDFVGEDDTPFETLSRKACSDAKKAQKVYAEHVLLPAAMKDDYDASDSTQHAPQVFVSLPPGCVRADCGGAYVRLKRENGVCHVPRDGSALYQQQGGAHHLYRIAKPFVAWMVGRTPYSSTAALVAHDLALRPQDVRAPWSAFDGRRWATVPAAHVRLESRVVASKRFACIRAASVVETQVDTLRALMLAPPRRQHGSFDRRKDAPDFASCSAQDAAKAGGTKSWVASTRDGSPLGQFMTAEQAEQAVLSANKRKQRATYLREVRDSGAVVVDLPATCGAAADACAGVYVPHDTSKKCTPKNARGRTYRHEEGAHYLYFYAPFSAWMIGSRPGSGSAALIAYDGAERPDLIAKDAPWRVYDGRAWREVADVVIRTLTHEAKPQVAEHIECTLADLPIYAWTPKGLTVKAGEEASAPVSNDGPPASSKPYLVYSCCGDRAVLPLWLKNGPRTFDLWATYYGSKDEDPAWKQDVDTFRRRKGGKFENLQALMREPGVADILARYDGILVLDDDVIIDAPRITLLFEIRKKCNLTVLQPAFDPRGKVSHAVTCVQPGNQLRLTNFVEMTCPLFAAPALVSFVDQFDADLKGWGADWWFLTVCARAMRGDASKKSATEPHPRHALRGGCAVVDAVSCVNPTDADKSGVREINVLQGREGRRDTWARIRRREAVDEWDHLQFEVVALDTTGAPASQAAKPAARPVRIAGTRAYELSTSHAKRAPSPEGSQDSATTPKRKVSA